MFQLGVESLTCAKLVELARQEKPQVQFDDAARERVRQFRSLVQSAVDSGKTYYGINTGFGLLADVRIEQSQLSQLQLNLVRSHACGVGSPSSVEIVKGLLILKAHQFCIGYSGVREDVVDKILEFLDKGITPYIPEKGSVGASGDLAPMAHMALSLVGEGKVHFEGAWCDAREALQAAKVAPLNLSHKEGLSLINGTQFMTVLASFALVRSREIERVADLSAALSLDAIRGTVSAFDPRIHEIRQQEGQCLVAENLSRLLDRDHNELMKSHEGCGKVQDPYSFRCVPQVHGASRDAILYCRNIVERELNAITDNPLIFENQDIVSGGNFHGQPIALAMDFLKIAISEFGSISERRIEKLTDPKMSDLPAFIIKDSGLNSGFMIPHVVAAALASENKILCHPASVDSIPTSADKEDHVSMGPIAARKALEVIGNVESILAIELLAACQALDLLRPLKTSPSLESVRGYVRGISDYMASDRSLHPDIEAIAEKIQLGELMKSVHSSGAIVN